MQYVIIVQQQTKSPKTLAFTRQKKFESDDFQFPVKSMELPNVTASLTNKA